MIDTNKFKIVLKERKFSLLAMAFNLLYGLIRSYKYRNIYDFIERLTIEILLILFIFSKFFTSISGGKQKVMKIKLKSYQENLKIKLIFWNPIK